MRIDPKAVAIARVAGITQPLARRILEEAAERNPSMLFGSFHTDAVVIALWLALHEEDGLDESDINTRIDAALEAAWAGIV